MKPDYSARKFGFPIMPIKDRLKAMTVVNPVSGCWEWQGVKHNGYGRTIMGSRKDGTRRTISAHRLSYKIWNGEIPEGYAEQGNGKSALCDGLRRVQKVLRKRRNRRCRKD